jgi:hypothetical protein
VLTIAQVISALHFNGEIKSGDILTSVSLLIATLTLMTAWIKERRLRRREYADKIRAAAARTAVAVARRLELAVAFYSEIQPLLTDTDTTLYETQNITKARDVLWRGLVELRAKSILRILDERIEEAYVGLYGYDTRIQTTYQQAMLLLGELDETAYLRVRRDTQEMVFTVGNNSEQPYTSAILGNPLREVSTNVRVHLESEAGMVVRRFQDQMVKLVNASDVAIIRHRFKPDYLTFEDGARSRPTSASTGGLATPSAGTFGETRLHNFLPSGSYPVTDHGRRAAMTQDQPPQNRRALIIGIDKYPNLSERAQLEGCVRDAREVAGLLAARFGFPASQMTLLLDEQATRDGILAAMRSLTETVKENDAVVVHYSGHGSQRMAAAQDRSRAGSMEETLVAHDSGHEDPHPNRDISSDELRDWLVALTRVTPNVTLVLDCCHSGTIASVRHDGKPAPKVRSAKPDLRKPPPSQKSNERDVHNGPASFVRHVVIAACRNRESAHEVVLEDGSHGALTWNLLRELERLPPGACPTYRDVFEPVRSSVYSCYPTQEPQLEGVRDRELFGLAELVPMSFLPVRQREGDRVLLGGGLVSGVTERSVWAIHPPQARAGTEILGRVEVIEVLAMTAKARILEEVRPGAIDRWCQAVEEVAAGADGLDRHWRRYRDALAIRNDRSGLRGKVDFNLAIQRNGQWERLDDGAEVDEDDRISFGVVSHHDKPLFIYVLDFGLTGNISQIYPVPGVSDPLDAGRTIEIGTLLDKLDLEVPEGVADGGDEILKLFATTREMDLSIHFQSVRGQTREMRASLDQTRSKDDWVTVERRFRLKRRPEGRLPGRVTRSGGPRSMS